MLGEPRRATHIGDFTLAFVVVAMLLTLATLERWALRDADPVAIDAPLVALDCSGSDFSRPAPWSSSALGTCR